MSTERTSEALRRFVVLLAGAMALWARSAPAEQGVRISIHRSSSADSKLDEALIRTRGELAAVGLRAEVPFNEEPSGAEAPAGEPRASIRFERSGSLLRIRAQGPLAETEVVQDIDLGAPDLTAEVIAVRAVEALRAAMTRFALREQSRGRRIPASIQGFIELREASEPVPRPATLPPSALAPPQGALSLRLGPGVTLVALAEDPAASAEFGAFYGRSQYLAGLRLCATLPAFTEADAGEVQFRRVVALAEFGAAARLLSSYEVFGTLGVGLGVYSIEGRPAAGYVGAEETHASALLAAELGAVRFFSAGFGAYAALSASVASDAPEVRVETEPVTTLDRPALWATFGVLAVVP